MSNESFKPCLVVNRKHKDEISDLVFFFNARSMNDQLKGREHSIVKQRGTPLSTYLAVHDLGAHLAGVVLLQNMRVSLVLKVL